jgi:hypothetical protein
MGHSNVKSQWSSGNLVFSNKVVGAKIQFQGVDVSIENDARLDFSSATIKAANTDGGIIKAGTASARVTEDTPDMKFMAFYFDNGATSGDNRGMYLRQYLTGAGGGGEALRVFTTIENVAGGTAHGAHISLSFGASGTLTDLGAAVRATLHIPDDAAQDGTLCAVQAEIYSDGDTSDPAGSQLSAIRIVNDGGNGKADVDDDCAAIEFAGFTVGDGKMLAVDNSPGACPNITHSIKIRLPDDSPAYLYAGATPVTA